MSNVYRFIYDSEYNENSLSVFPQASTVKARHYFEDGCTWHPILWQFCKFLESTGYVGVTEKVVLIDDYGLDTDGLFQTTTSDKLASSIYDNSKLNEYEFSTDEVLDSQDKDAY